MSNPLLKYYRQPKIYLSLPSGGNYWPPGALNGDPSNLPVFGMTAMDEIMFKTPDALFSGEAIASVIKSCIPEIIDPWSIPGIDIDSILVAIRIATYGQMMPASFKCQNCQEENKFDLDLSKTLDYFSSIEYKDKVIAGPLVISIRPLNYKEQTHVAMKTYELRRKIVQNVDGMPEKEKAKMINNTINEIATVQVEGFQRCIVSIEVENESVDDPVMINEFIKNSDREIFDKLKTHMEGLTEIWKIQSQKTVCAECEHENKVNIGLDNSDFFGRN